MSLQHAHVALGITGHLSWQGNYVFDPQSPFFSPKVVLVMNKGRTVQTFMV
ncbi:hypothetical protein Bpfe_017297, partial [Biomphalaria pfeifferi]